MIELQPRHYEMVALIEKGWTKSQIAEHFHMKQKTLESTLSKLKNFHGLTAKRPSIARKYKCKVCGVLINSGRARCPLHKVKAMFASKKEYNNWAYHNIPGKKEKVRIASMKWVAHKRMTDPIWREKYNKYHREYNARARKKVS